jgi:hypothetical protein
VRLPTLPILLARLLEIKEIVHFIYLVPNHHKLEQSKSPHQHTLSPSNATPTTLNGRSTTRPNVSGAFPQLHPS